jgi:hypothetical protein
VAENETFSMKKRLMCQRFARAFAEEAEDQFRLVKLNGIVQERTATEIPAREISA